MYSDKKSDSNQKYFVHIEIHAFLSFSMKNIEYIFV